MCRAIREYHEKTGFIVGFKPAGGIRWKEFKLVSFMKLTLYVSKATYLIEAEKLQYF